MLVAVVRVVPDEVGERDQVRDVAVAQVPQPVGGVHGAVERRVPRQRPVGPLERLVEPAVVGEGAGDVRVDRQVVGVGSTARPSAARPPGSGPTLRYAYPSHTSPIFDGWRVRLGLAQRTARSTSPSRRASADAAPSSRPCSGCTVTALRASVRYGVRAPGRPGAPGRAGGADLHQDRGRCAPVRGARPARGRSPRALRPSRCRGVRRSPRPAAPALRPGGRRRRAGGRGRRRHRRRRGGGSGRGRGRRRSAAASRASVSCTSGRVGARANAPARWPAAWCQVALVECQPGQRQFLRRGQRGSSVPSGTSSSRRQLDRCAAGQA